MNITEWHKVPGFKNVEVNGVGDIKGHIPTIESDGQRWVNIFEDGRYRKVRLAELVLSAFGIEVPEGQHIRFKGSRIDCRLANLYLDDSPEPQPVKFAPSNEPAKPKRRFNP